MQNSILIVSPGNRYNDRVKQSFAILFGVIVAMALPLSGAVVRISGTPGSWKLERDGKPYFIRGAGGVSDFAQFAAAGGNSIRTWGSDGTTRVMDEAWKHGVTTTVGFWLPHQSEGADYTDAERCRAIKASILEDVRKFKDHPGVLLWALGNEMELGIANEDALWCFVNEVAIAIKEIDPNHPVGTVVAEVWKSKVEKISALAPALDWVGINSYGGVMNVGLRWKSMGGNRPWILTEFGPPGAEELGLDETGCPNEWTSTQKANWYRRAYQENMKDGQPSWCLGSYAFLWGNKVEGTPTWFGLVTRTGEMLAAAEALQQSWGVVPLKNHVPEIDALQVTQKVPAGQTISVTAKARDADGDPLLYSWEVLEENRYYGATGLGGKQPRSCPETIVDGQGTPRASLRFPEEGYYRLYAWVRDGKGGAAFANRVICVGSGKRALRGSACSLPCAVYLDGAEENWWPTGYMGDSANLNINLRDAKMPASGKNAIHVQYFGNDWAGLVWQNPPDDWMNLPGGIDLTGAKALSFKARGKTGRETVNFQVGLSTGRCPDSGGGRLQNLRLSSDWKTYRIDLTGEDLQCIKTGFAFSFGGTETREFWIDDIVFQ